MPEDRIGPPTDSEPIPDPATPEMWERERIAWAAYRAQLDADDAVRDEWREAIEAIRAIRAETGWPNRG